MKPQPSIHQIYFNSAYLGIQLSEVRLPKQCYMFGLVRNEKVFALADNPTIREQDWLVAVTLNESLMPELDQCLQHSVSQAH